ncbi:MAG: hypothetical protein DLM62_14835, partial [Pseudonocardiales bacterium]
ITRHDRVVSAARQRRLAAAVPEALVYDIDGGHDVFLSAPGRFAAALRDACQAICSGGVITGPDDLAAGRARC